MLLMVNFTTHYFTIIIPWVNRQLVILNIAISYIFFNLFIYDLFNDAVCSLDYIESIGIMIMDHELEGVGNVAVVA
jgi:hypothetical protein